MADVHGRAQVSDELAGGLGACLRAAFLIRNFYDDGFASLYAKYSGGRPRTFTLPERRKIKKIAKSRPSEHGLPFSTWSLSKLADFLVAGGWSTTSPTRACGSCSVTRASHFKP